MRKKFLLFCLLIIPVFMHAQELTPEVIASSGGDHQNPIGSLSWTMGELAVKTLEGAEAILNQGFHQPIIVESDPSSLDESYAYDIQIYPVPATDFITVEFQDIESELTIQVLDLQGKLLITQQVNTQNLSFDLSSLPSSEYILNIVNQEKQLVKSFKIVKY